jgi:hypothetical protein
MAPFSEEWRSKSRAEAIGFGACMSCTRPARTARCVAAAANPAIEYFMNSAAIFIGSSTRQPRSRCSRHPSRRADQRLERRSDVRSEQLRRCGIARPRAAPKARALREQRTAVGVRPTLDLLIAEVREVGRQVVDFLLIVSSLQTDHVIIGVRGDWIGGIACAVEGECRVADSHNRRIETTMCSDRFRRRRPLCRR